MKLRNDVLNITLTAARREAFNYPPPVAPDEVEAWAGPRRTVHVTFGPSLTARRKARLPGLMLAKCEAFYYAEGSARLQRARAQRANHPIMHTIACRIEVDNLRACAAERPLRGTIHLREAWDRCYRPAEV